MPRIGPVHWKVLDSLFRQLDFVFERQRGDHRVYRKPGVARPLVIPADSEIDTAIIKSNLRTAGISRDRYFALLAEVRSAA
jgi:predicted RNA binding protein YcfA (HicA-like mRNA interferase family)